MTDGPKHPWQSQKPERREQILATVKAAGRHGLSWKAAAAMCGVSERIVHYWRKDDPEGKLNTAFEAGKTETATKLSLRLEAKALNPDEEGNTQALIHATKHFMRISDHQTTVNVDAGEVANAKPDEKAKWREALSHLGLESLMGGDSDEG